jgi:hypothetical protein
VIPRSTQAIKDLALKLMISVAPQTRSAFAASNTGMIAMLLQCLAQDFDRAAQVRSQDVDEMCELFRALPATVDAGLARQIDAYLNAGSASLRISDLDAQHADATRLLIELHVWAERNRDAVLERAIWDYLARHVERHAYDMPV